ncbi:hypothetical protein FALCPG4_005659 [Fusarium falciforme]
MEFGPSIRQVSVLAFILALQFAVLVNGLPATANVERVTSHEQETAFADGLVLDPRQVQEQDIPDALAKFPAGLLNQLLRMFSSLPEGEKALDAAGKLLTPLQQLLANAVGIDTSRDDLAQKAPCSDITSVRNRRFSPVQTPWTGPPM